MTTAEVEKIPKPKVKKDTIHKHKINGVDFVQHIGCDECTSYMQLLRDGSTQFAPPHDGHAECLYQRAIAAGGDKIHCACDVCFFS